MTVARVVALVDSYRIAKTAATSRRHARVTRKKNQELRNEGVAAMRKAPSGEFSPRGAVYDLGDNLMSTLAWSTCHIVIRLVSGQAIFKGAQCRVSLQEHVPLCSLIQDALMRYILTGGHATLVILITALLKWPRFNRIRVLYSGGFKGARKAPRP